MVKEIYQDERSLTGDKSITPGNIFHISYTFPDAGLMKLTVQDASGQALHFCIADEENAKKILKHNTFDGFKPEVAGELAPNERQSSIETYIKSGKWYALIHNPKTNQTVTGRFVVAYAH